MSYYEKLVDLLPGQFKFETYETSHIREYICDTADDIQSLPADCEMGSTARITGHPAIYRKMSTGEWVLQMISAENEVTSNGN